MVNYDAIENLGYSLGNLMQGQNTYLFDKQTLLIANVVVSAIQILNNVMPMQEHIYNAFVAIDHPMVTACTNASTCGPIHLFWENKIMLYNDATALQTWWYPIAKLCVVITDYVIIGTLYSIPLLINLGIHFGRYFGVLEAQKKEFSSVQATFNTSTSTSS